MSTTDALQWTQIADINRRLFAQEQINIQQQSLIVSEGKHWRDWVVGLRNDVDRIDVNINELFNKLDTFVRNHGPVAHDQIWNKFKEVDNSISQLWGFANNTAPPSDGNNTNTILGVSLPVAAAIGIGGLYLLTRKKKRSR